MRGQQPAVLLWSVAGQKSKRVKTGTKPVPAVQNTGSPVTEPEAVVMDKVLTSTALPSSTLTPAVLQPGNFIQGINTELEFPGTGEGI